MQRLHVEGFKVSNGRIEKWKRCHNVRYVKLSVEPAGVSGVTVKSWKKEYVRWLKVMQQRVSGTRAKPGVFGKPFQIEVLCSKELHVMVARN